MLRQAIIYLLLSIVVVVFAQYGHLLIVRIDMLYTYINVQLTPIFNRSGLGAIVRNVFTLVLLPVILAAIPALFYRLIKGENMPFFIPITWVLWLIIVLSNVLIR